MLRNERWESQIRISLWRVNRSYSKSIHILFAPLVEFSWRWSIANLCQIVVAILPAARAKLDGEGRMYQLWAAGGSEGKGLLFQEIEPDY